MTRITNFGRKRTYLDSQTDQGSVEVHQPLAESSAADGTASAPPKKKRKRTPKSKRDGNGTQPKENTLEGVNESSTVPQTSENASAKKKDRKKKFKKVTKESLSERRRLKRIAEKNVETVCFACREKGHSARDCPKAESKQVGICYRCGSTRHTLSRCKKPEDPLNALPHASCFVCNGKGHLASACPQNKSKGIYPNGGCCKLCGDTSHLAKDCGIRKKDVNSLAPIMGMEQDVGADEDDFHIIGRRMREIDQDEKRAEKAHRKMGVMVGAQSGVVKSFGDPPAQTKKVVYF